MSTRARISCLVGIFVALLLAIGAWGVRSTTVLQNRIMEQHSALTEAELSVVLAELSVRRQLDDWKNILLRGEDVEELEAYWADFLEAEGEARTQLERTVGILPPGSVASGLATTFLREHELFGARHREALEVFRGGGSGAQARSDALVEGQVDPLLLPLRELARVLEDERAMIEPNLRDMTLRRSVTTMIAVVLASLTAFVVLALAMHRWMNLPLLSAGRKEGAAPARFTAPREPGTAVVAPRNWKRVVVAEEDAEARRALAGEMKTWDCEVLEAGSASELARLLELDGHSAAGAMPDLVVASDSLPGVGVETLVRWLKAEPSTREIPVVLREANGGVVTAEGRELLAAAVPKSISLGDWQRKVLRVLRNPPASPEPAGEWSVQGAFPRLRSTRILAAEDEPLNRKYLGLMLDKVGAEAALVADGEAAVEAVGGERFEVILMDCGLPGMDGFEATRRIRERTTEGPSPVVIGVTAHTDEAVLEKCAAAGMDACVPKPVKLEYLCLVVEEELAKRDAG